MSLLAIGDLMFRADTADLCDGDTMSPLLRDGVVLGAFTRDDIANKFGVSRITVDAWVSGEVSPSRNLRGSLVVWICNMCKQKALL